MNERELQAKFIDFLRLEKAFPDSAIRSEVSIVDIEGKVKYQADIALIDPRRNEFIALIEIKSKREHRPLRSAVAQLLEYGRDLQKPHLPLYLISPPIENSNRVFEIDQVLPNGDVNEVYPDEFPGYDALVAGDKAASKTRMTQKVTHVADNFRTLCWILCGAVLIILALDISNIFVLNTRQLTLIAVAAGLAILPYAAKFKLLGVEFERLNGSHDNDR